MKSNIFKLTIIILLLSPFILRADTVPVFIDDTGGTTGTGSGTGTGGGSGGTGSNGGGTSVTTSSKSDTFVQTDAADNITYTTAVLHGTAGDKSANPTLPLTAYFRYSKAEISPIFCNDIYGTNMISTKDIPLGAKDKTCTKGGTYPYCTPPASQSFYQKISGLAPDTTYYYCAIASNRSVIGYQTGEDNIVKNFHTRPYGTTVKTEDATDIGVNTATLNGSFSSIYPITAYFQYKQYDMDPTTEWNDVCKKDYSLNGETSIQKSVQCNLLEIAKVKLDPNTRYQFRLVASANSGGENKIVYGYTSVFFTSDNTDGTTGGDTGGDGNTTGGGTGSGTTGGTGWGTTGGTTGLGTTGGTGLGTTGGTTGVGTSGNWTTGGGTGTWTTTSGTGGMGSAVWTSTGSGVGTWSSSSGSGTWRTLTGTIGSGSTGIWSGTDWGSLLYGNNTAGIINTTPLSLGQTGAPPADAIVRYHEGIETVFVRQIVKDSNFTKLYGYQSGGDLQAFAWNLADQFARTFGYVSENGKEIRVSLPDIAAYQLQLNQNVLTVYEYYNNKIVDVRKATTVFKTASNYEYYFKK